jgi:pSer/pThr/pTyr-binding forkhead associated (FHA) protein
VSLRILGHRVPVPADGPLPVGRDAPAFADLPGMADHLQISRCHAELYWVGAHLYIRDTKSTNGTFVDGQRVTTPRRLEPGQTLRLAEDVSVQVESLDLDEHGLPR